MVFSQEPWLGVSNSPFNHLCVFIPLASNGSVILPFRPFLPPLPFSLPCSGARSDLFGCLMFPPELTLNFRSERQPRPRLPSPLCCCVVINVLSVLRFSHTLLGSRTLRDQISLSATTAIFVFLSPPKR